MEGKELFIEDHIFIYVEIYTAFPVQVEVVESCDIIYFRIYILYRNSNRIVT